MTRLLHITRRRLLIASWLVPLCFAAGNDGTDAPDAAAARQQVPLETELPRPVFVGTPRFIVSPNLGPITGRTRARFMVPEGTVNLARGRPVSTSDPRPFVGSPKLLTDGSKEAEGNSFLEMNPGVQWVQIDLGRPCRVSAVIVWHYHAEARVYHDVVVRLSDDPDFVGAAVTVFNNDHDNSAGLGVGRDKEYVDTFEGRLIDAGGTAARYVRLYSNGNTSDDMNDYTEVEVFGRPCAGKGRLSAP